MADACICIRVATKVLNIVKPVTREMELHTCITVIYLEGGGGSPNYI